MERTDQGTDQGQPDDQVQAPTPDEQASDESQSDLQAEAERLRREQEQASDESRAATGYAHDQAQHDAVRPGRYLDPKAAPNAEEAERMQKLIDDGAPDKPSHLMGSATRPSGDSAGAAVPTQSNQPFGTSGQGHEGGGIGGVPSAGGTGAGTTGSTTGSTGGTTV